MVTFWRDIRNGNVCVLLELGFSKRLQLPLLLSCSIRREPR